MSNIIQLLLALPKLWSMVKEILAAFKKAQEASIEKSHAEARKKLEGATTEEEIKRATEEYFKNP
jgi:hypothetical protein